MEDLIKKEQFYSNPIQEVWEAISRGENISKWFIHADFKPEVGYKYKFTHEKTTVSGRVLEVDPITKLIYSWIVGGTNDETIVKWFLEEKDGGTVIQLEHSGFTNYSKEMGEQMHGSSTKGWDACLEELGRFLEG